MKAIRQLSLAWKMALILLLPVLGILSFGIQRINEQSEALRESAAMDALSSLAVKIGDLVHEIQKERGRSAGFLGAKGAKFTQELDSQRKATDAKFKELSDRLRALSPDAYGEEFHKKLNTAAGEFAEAGRWRKQVSALEVSAPQAIKYYTGLVEGYLDVVMLTTKVSTDARLSSIAFTYISVLQAKERVGIERAILNNTFAADAFQQGMFIRLVSMKAAQESFLKEFSIFASDEQKSFYAQQVAGPAIAEVARMEDIAFEKSQTGKFGVSAEHWFSTITQKIDLMKRVEDRIANDLERASAANTARGMRALQATAGVMALIALGLLISAMLSMATVRSITRPVHDLIGGIRDGSKLVSVAADESCRVSEAVAHNSAHEVTALKDTAVSMARVLTATLANGDNTKRAKVISGHNMLLAQEGLDGVLSMARIMGEVNQSAGGVSSMAKVMEEIAFQTNILALNAAVEAARAGEAGLGFAVVADEVRSLALKSAGAAKEAEVLIQQSIRNTRTAIHTSDSLVTKLSLISEESGTLDGLISGIADGSSQQSAGIGQIDSSIAKLKSLAQSTSEESTSSAKLAETMREQVAVFDLAVEQLAQLIGV